MVSKVRKMKKTRISDNFLARATGMMVMLLNKKIKKHLEQEVGWLK